MLCVMSGNHPTISQLSKKFLVLFEPDEMSLSSALLSKINSSQTVVWFWHRKGKNGYHKATEYPL